MAEAAIQGANYTSGAIWGSFFSSRPFQPAAQPGIQTSDFLITRQPALPAELQPPQTVHSKCP